MRQPTEANLQKIRELMAEAGGIRELIRWIKATPQKSRGRGRPPGEDKWEEVDFRLLQEADRRCAADRSETKPPHADRLKSVSQVISEVVDESWRAGESIGASQPAVCRRLFSRIRPAVIRGTKGAKITLSKPQFEFSLTQHVQPRGEKRTINVSVSGFRPPFFDQSSTIERPPPVYQPGSVEWQEQQDRSAQTEKK
jgi:hypothetical protein